MADYQRLQHQISLYQANAPLEDYYEEGYAVLRQCTAEALAVLTADYDTGLLQVPTAPEQQTMQQLQRVLLDASARRFQAQKIYLRAVAATRWVNTRNAILQLQRSHAGHAAALQQADINLRSEISTITDERVVNELRMADWQARHWLQEDPSLQAMLHWICSQR
ncbi:hypothetical protein MMC12_004355 [Toensbergia leucococca]|nr:hypothetical protein [Toensbergia leucococca]